MRSFWITWLCSCAHSLTHARTRSHTHALTNTQMHLGTYSRTHVHTHTHAHARFRFPLQINSLLSPFFRFSLCIDRERELREKKNTEPVSNKIEFIFLLSEWKRIDYTREITRTFSERLKCGLRHRRLHWFSSLSPLLSKSKLAADPILSHF